MDTKWHGGGGILNLAVVLALLLGMCAYADGAIALKDSAKKIVRVVVRLETNSATEDQLVREIRRQLKGRVSVTGQEVQTAARDALDLVGKAKDPKKGVIFVKTKKYTICVSWGSDKCKDYV